MVNVTDRIKERIEIGKKAILDGADWIDLAKRAKIDVTKQETEMMKLTEELDTIERAVKEKETAKI